MFVSLPKRKLYKLLKQHGDVERLERRSRRQRQRQKETVREAEEEETEEMEETAIPVRPRRKSKRIQEANKRYVFYMGCPYPKRTE